MHGSAYGVCRCTDLLFDNLGIALIHGSEIRRVAGDEAVHHTGNAAKIVNITRTSAVHPYKDKAQNNLFQGVTK